MSLETRVGEPPSRSAHRGGGTRPTEGSPALSRPSSRFSGVLWGDVLGGDVIILGGDRGGGVDMISDGFALGTGNLDGLTTGDQTPGDQVRGDWAGDEGDRTGPGRG